jgi:hypothetical protein
VVDPNARDGGRTRSCNLPGKILKAGTARNPDYPTVNAAATAWVIDTTQPSPRGARSRRWLFGRTQLTLLTLPDGTVLCTGGAGSSDVYDTGSAVHEAEIWNPATETWSTMAAMSEPRLYHSTALLLPDARVLVSGGGRFGPTSRARRSSRPRISSRPAPHDLVRPGRHPVHGTLRRQTPDAASIAKVSLLRTGSVTHAFDENARFVPLSFTVSGSGSLDAVAPPNGNVARRATTCCFLVDGNGVPSVASMVRIPASSEDSIPPSAPSGLGADHGAGARGPDLDRGDRTTSPSPATTSTAPLARRRPLRGQPRGTEGGTAFTDTGFASGTYYWVVTAQDANGNVGPPSNEIARDGHRRHHEPTVSMTSPSPGTVTGSLTLAATASDNIGVAGVQFLVDGASYGAEDTVPPFSVSWDSTAVANGTHQISARARDARGQHRERGRGLRSAS